MIQSVSTTDLQRSLEAKTQPAINAMQALADSFLRIGKAINDAFHAAYLKAGAPYGETHEGLRQWIDNGFR
jgi:hypothetical protein